MAPPPPKRARRPPLPDCEFVTVGLDEIFDARSSSRYHSVSKRVHFEEEPSSFRKLTKCANLAIWDYNSHEKTDYRFVKIEMATYQTVSGVLFHITFHARNARSAKNEYRSFQATVHHNKRRRTVRRVRMKGSSTWYDGTLCELVD